jgi:hypothetical protein
MTATQTDEALVEEVARAIANAPVPLDLDDADLETIARATIPLIRQRTLEEASQLLHDFYLREIGRLMQQAEHWAQNGKPLAVHHRIMDADAYFQVVVQFDPARRKLGFGEPFANMADELSRQPIKPLGPYPPSPVLHNYRNPLFVASALAHQPPQPAQGDGK